MRNPCPWNPASIQGVVFDLDGTLVDSRLDFDRIRQEIGCPKERGLLEHVATLTDPEQIRTAEATIYRHEMAGAAAATWIPGAKQLLRTLHAKGIPTAILTRNTRAAVRLTIDTLEIPVDLVLTREDCKPKPDPEGLLQIAQTWGLPPRAMVYIGDYTFDIHAARNADMLSCLYRHPVNGTECSDADWVIGHFDELNRVFAGVAV